MLKIAWFLFDADGIRVSAETDGNVTDYLVDKNRDYAQVLEERDGSGGLIVSYVYGDDLIRQKRGDAFSYYQYDGQLSTRQLTDGSGNVTDTCIYDAFGEVLSQSGNTENSYLYTGEQYDPNAEFYYLRARYYDPAGGRFLSSDPYAGRQSEPVTLHKYLYANANPVMYNDPSGKISIAMDLSVTNSMMNNLIRMQVNTTVRSITKIIGGSLLTTCSYFKIR
ncbi:Rhs family protein [Desulfonema ishimotonii]|uniref:Rhs family protein n=1 Tax=Desulfonema ishimotonii TaxID=45657 RepID=A0A401FVN3_9BACT|nr:RHS repeat-associated core domain-containing protein [Desulfonema ishimotonii]GBC61020.1 Rhs family protein [Desulfonema ishimotonii]